MFSFLRCFRKPVSDQDYANEFAEFLDGKKWALSHFLYEVLSESPGSYKLIDRIRGLRKRVPATDWRDILNLQIVGRGRDYTEVSGVLRGQTLFVRQDNDMRDFYNYHIFRFELNGREFPGQYQLLPLIHLVRYVDRIEKNIPQVLARYRSMQEENKRRQEEAEAVKRPFKDLLNA